MKRCGALKISSEKKIGEWSAIRSKDEKELTRAGVKFNKGEIGDEL